MNLSTAARNLVSLDNINGSISVSVSHLSPDHKVLAQALASGRKFLAPSEADLCYHAAFKQYMDWSKLVRDGSVNGVAVQCDLTLHAKIRATPYTLVHLDVIASTVRLKVEDTIMPIEWELPLEDAILNRCHFFNDKHDMVAAAEVEAYLLGKTE